MHISFIKNPSESFRWILLVVYFSLKYSYITVPKLVLYMI